MILAIVHSSSVSSTTASYAAAQSAEARIVMGLTQEQVTELLESPIAFEHFVDNLETVVNSRILKREWWTGNDNVARMLCCFSSAPGF